WVDRVAHITNFVMQMRTGATAGAAAQTYRLASFHEGSYIYQRPAHVPVKRFQAIIMAHHNVISVSAAIPFRDPDHAIEGSINGIAGVQIYIGSIMPAVAPVTKIRSNGRTFKRHFGIAFPFGFFQLYMQRIFNLAAVFPV